MKNLGQKIERVDNATNEIMDAINDYFWIHFGYDLTITLMVPCHTEKGTQKPKCTP